MPSGAEIALGSRVLDQLMTEIDWDGGAPEAAGRARTRRGRAGRSGLAGQPCEWALFYPAMCIT